MRKPSGILLAAGGSIRLGRPKQLLYCGRQTLVRRQARLLLGVCHEVVVVTGAHGPGVQASLKGLDLKLCHNAAWREGMGHSLAFGMRHLDPRTPSVLVLLCDQYRVTAADLENVVAAWHTGRDDIVASRWQDASGPPALFPRARFDDLRTLSGDSGARSLLETTDGVRHVDVENAAWDINTPEDMMEMAVQSLD